MPATASDTSVSTPTAASLASAGLHDVMAYVPPVGANVLHVGVGQAFTTIASALAAAHNGDVVLVQAGTYVNDFATVSAKVSLIGVGGMVNMVATIPPPNGKAILTVDTDATIQNFTFSGAKVPDANGAGIRYEGGNLTLQNCGFHNNENGLLSSAVSGGTLLIQNCDFTHNGAGNGSTHNIYVGAIQQLTIEASRFSDAVVGHEIKSRAYNTLITGNVISDGPTGNGSYSIDLPNGGNGVVTGNLIEKGPQTENQNIIHFGGESIPYAGSSLLVQGNQITNDRPGAVAVLNQTALTVSITGNSFTGLDPARVAVGPAHIGGNIVSPNADGTGTALPDAVLSGIVPGSVQVFTDALAHQVTLTSANFAVQGGAGRLTVQAVAGHIVAQGGTGGLDFSEAGGSGGNQVTTTAGSTNSFNLSGQDSIDSEGTDAITTGLGNVTAQIGGAATVNEGLGNNQWSVLGSLHLTGNGGAPHFTLNAAASLSIDGALTYFAIQSSGGAASYDISLGGKHVQASLTGGSWTMQGWSGSTSFATAAGPNGVTMHLGDGQVQVISGGADQIWAGSGDTVVQASGAANIYAGTGTLEVYGRGQSGANVWGNGGTYLIGGDTGGITYHGGDLASTVQAILSSITLLGGAGHLTVAAGSRQIITGGAGGLTVTEDSGGGANTITTQAGSTNAITLNNGTLDSWGNDTITQPGGNNTLSIHGNATIQGSVGNSHINIFGHATLAGRGGDWLTLAPGADATVQAGSHLDVGLSQSSLRVTAPGGNPSLVALSMQNATGSVVIDGGRTAVINTAALPVGTSITVDGGSSQIYSHSADQVRTGAGTAMVRAYVGNSEVWGGSGQLTFQDWDGTAGDKQTIHGGTGSVSIAGSNSDVTYFGGAGAAVLDGSARNLAICGGAGSITVARAGATSTTFIGGSGTAMLNIGHNGGAVTFGTGNTTVQESAWGAVSYTATSASRGTQVITGFHVGTDMLYLAGTAVAGQTTDGTGTTLTTTAGAHIVLQGIKAPIGMIVAKTPVLNPVMSFVSALAPQPSTAAAATVTLVPAAIGLTLVSTAAADPLSGGTPDAANSDAQAAAASQSAAGLQTTPDPASGSVSMPMTGSTPAPAAPDPVSSQLGSLQAAELATPPQASPAFAVTEAATGQEAQSDGDAYAGPVALLQRQFIWSGTNGIVVSANTSNVFLHGGNGDDALAVQDGNNVLDGGAGSNFLVGGTGAGGGSDTFFVDGRGGNTWSTIVNFHQGDSMTLWGFQAGTSTQPWTASDGAAGYTGATIHSELAGAGTGVNASATFAGLTMDDVQHLTTVTGTVGGVSFLNVAYTG